MTWAERRFSLGFSWRLSRARNGSRRSLGAPAQARKLSLPPPSARRVLDASAARLEPVEKLDLLRAKMAEILARNPLRAPTPASQLGPTAPEPAISLIDSLFVRAAGTGAPLARRPTPQGHRVGAIPVWTARRADPNVLALLALDPSLADCDLERALYLDTETTGLMGGTGTVAFLLGLARFEPDVGDFVVEQLLLRGFADEPAMLEHLAARLESASVIVTYNGKAFDLPLLRTRAIMNRVGPLPERPHLDLLHVARRLHKHRLRACNLSRIEEHVLGRARVDDVSGADVAAIYYHYLRTGDVAALEPVVEHNRLDVVSMIALVGLYGEPLADWATNTPPRLADHRKQLCATEGTRGAQERWGPATEGTRGAQERWGLAPGDLVAAARVAVRAGDLELAHRLAQAGIERGDEVAGLWARGDVARARGDKAAALCDYESAALAAGEDTAPSLRLELAKLYEHHARAYEKALATVAQGTTEPIDRHVRRSQRLARKLETSATRTAKATKDAAKPRARRPRLKAGPS
ncbi:MAG: ribonuclease H-like domain-containing protein [Polyangiaceae bacterium]